LRTRGDHYSPSVRTRLEAGALQPATAYIDAQRLRTQMKSEWKAALQGIDAIAMPTTPITALPRGSETRTYEDGSTEPVGVALTRFDFAANLLGLPALSVPCATIDGMPVGLQILARPYDDRLVLRIGHAYQKAVGHHPYAPLAPCT
jgi:aspartyl-tRNA(Asn)/glutamyl-tRNA(Gln) amidotransferase subunit A